jgi:hypothetical protein
VLVSGGVSLIKVKIYNTEKWLIEAARMLCCSGVSVSSMKFFVWSIVSFINDMNAYAAIVNYS